MYFVAKMLSVGLSILLYAMLARAILPFFVNPEENKFYFFLLVITEPFVIPVRFIMEKLGVGQNTPIDISFMAAYLFYWLMQMIMPAV